MFYTKDGYPEVNEIVYSTVTKIYGNTVFVKLDEYDKEGVLTISEIAPGRIRNLRDYVTEDKKIVCKVLRVDPNHNRIDVSLRRVSVPMMKTKLEEIKKEEFAEKVYSDIAKELKTTKEELFEKTYETIFEEYSTVFEVLYEIMLDNTKVEMFVKLSPKEKEIFVKGINDKIKPEEIVFKKNFKLTSLSSEGATIVKKTIKKALNSFSNDKKSVHYLAAGEYEIVIRNDDVKSADLNFKSFQKELESQAKEFKLNLSF